MTYGIRTWAHEIFNFSGEIKKPTAWETGAVGIYLMAVDALMNYIARIHQRRLVCAAFGAQASQLTLGLARGGTGTRRYPTPGSPALSCPSRPPT